MKRVGGLAVVLMLLWVGLLGADGKSALDVLYDSAVTSLTAKEYDRTRELCNKILDGDKGYYRAYTLLADLEDKLKNKEGQFDDLYKALEILNAKEKLTDAEKADYNIIDTQLDKLNPTRAKMKKRRAEYVDQLMQAAQAEYDARRVSNAVRAIQTVLKVDPRNDKARELLQQYQNTQEKRIDQVKTGALFNGTDLTGWKAVNGDWSVEKGAVRGGEDASGAGPYLLLCNKVCNNNFQFIVGMKLSAEGQWGSESVLALQTDSTDNNLFLFQCDGSNVTLNVLPKKDTPDQVVYPRPLGVMTLEKSIGTDKLAEMILRKTGPQLECLIDGVVVLSYRFDDPNALGKLRVLLGVAKGVCNYYDMRLEDYEVAAPPDNQDK